MANVPSHQPWRPNGVQPSGRRILFFSRGRGRGHAIPDVEICTRLRRCLPEDRITTVSYGTGAATLRELGEHPIAMPLKDDNDYVSTLVSAGTIIAAHHPDIIISHEEFAVVPFAAALRIPVITVIDWFLDEDTFLMQSLGPSSTIVFLEEQGVFPEPSFLKDKVEYLGPIARPMSYGIGDKSAVRRELGLGDSMLVISVIPGAWATEERAPLHSLVLEAFEAIQRTDKFLIWIAGTERDRLQRLLGDRPDVRVHPAVTPIEKVMVASDLVITKGNRGTTLDACALGVPSIALSSGANPIDDAILNRVKSNLLLRPSGLDPRFLATCIVERAQGGFNPDTIRYFGNFERVAETIARKVDDHVLRQ